MSGGRSRGFTLIEVLIVVLIIGLVAAIAVPNLYAALQRGRQKRTMSDMRSIGTAIESYVADHSGPPPAAPGNIRVLVPYLVPKYTSRVPELDGWKSPYAWDVRGSSYFVGSSGSDATFKSPPPGAGPTRLFTDDIWFEDGIFTTYPDGSQS